MSYSFTSSHQRYYPLNEDERVYAANYNTHVDFLIINHVSKKPILVVETDGYSYHNEKTQQYQRDIKKDHILTLYEIPICGFQPWGAAKKKN